MKIFAASLFFALGSAVLGAEPTQTVFVNGNIYTMNERQPRAEAIAVKGDRIVNPDLCLAAFQRLSHRRKIVEVAAGVLNLAPA